MINYNDDSEAWLLLIVHHIVAYILEHLQIFFAVKIIANQPLFGFHALPDNSLEISLVEQLADPCQMVSAFVKLDA